MQQSQLLKTLQTLDKSEWRRFHNYLRSPFFSQRADLLRLAEHLEKQLAREPSAADFSKAKAWQKVFPPDSYRDKAFDEKELRYLMSYLLAAAENFLAQIELEADPAQHKLLIFNALKRRGLEQRAEPKLAKLLPIAIGTAQRRSLERSHRELLNRQQRHAEIEVSSVVRNFTHDLVAETLREGCAFVEMQIASPDSYRDDGSDFPLLAVVLDFCEQQRLVDESPAIALLFHTFRMLEAMHGIPIAIGSGEAAFFEVKKRLDESPELPAALRREAWLRAINFAIRQQNQGSRAFGEEAFHLYQTGIENGLILENGQLSKKAYSNTLVLALLVGPDSYRDAWAEDFLKNYRQFLPEHERENTYRHNLATLFFKQKQFGRVLETLQNVQFTDSLHNLDDRRLLLCSYLELGEWPALESLLDSFGIWLRRAKNLGYHREIYANLVKFTRKLMELRQQAGATAEQFERLREEVAGAKNVAAREWLLEKCG